jgi:rhamnose utilization protein RhaD (predicted bifunctional aldolase and dehydrogenase)
MIMEQLVQLSLDLGKPEHDLAMLGEGNTSALEGDRFYVKASGTSLGCIDAHGFVLLDRAAAEGLLNEDLPTDEAITAGLMRVMIEPDGRRPSVEAMMHAYLLGLPGVNFVGHTHPSSVNGLLCSNNAEALVNLRLFPDQIVCCGPSPVYVPYTDPGLTLARMVRERVTAWMDVNGMTPRAILLQNHGLFALGKTAREVLSCSLMWSKTARIIATAVACGGVHPMTPEQVARIFTRPDEKYREGVLAGPAK